MKQTVQRNTMLYKSNPVWIINVNNSLHYHRPHCKRRKKWEKRRKNLSYLHILFQIHKFRTNVWTYSRRHWTQRIDNSKEWLNSISSHHKWSAKNTSFTSTTSSWRWVINYLILPAPPLHYCSVDEMVLHRIKTSRICSKGPMLIATRCCGRALSQYALLLLLVLEIAGAIAARQSRMDRSFSRATDCSTADSKSLANVASVWNTRSDGPPPWE